jgi:hypothetical protein
VVAVAAAVMMDAAFAATMAAVTAPAPDLLAPS